MKLFQRIQERTQSIRKRLLNQPSDPTDHHLFHNASVVVLLTLCLTVLTLALPQVVAQAHPLDPPPFSPSCYAHGCDGKVLEATNCRDGNAYIAQIALIHNNRNVVIGDVEQWISPGCRVQWTNARTADQTSAVSISATLLQISNNPNVPTVVGDLTVNNASNVHTTLYGFDFGDHFTYISDGSIQTDPNSQSAPPAFAETPPYPMYNTPPISATPTMTTP